MGVPSFYRWLIEKYPRIVKKAIEQDGELVNGVEMPVDMTQPNPNDYEFDNLYLDFNGIVHNASHGEDIVTPSNEEEMFTAIIKYTDRLFSLIRPRKILYIAIDGIAPRAKMNQQRSRRFRSSQEAEEAKQDSARLRQEMASKGMKVPKSATKDVWDSNVITPGTEFMEQLSKMLIYYVAERQNRDPAWKEVKVIVSDAQSPGEGVSWFVFSKNVVMFILLYQTLKPNR